MIVTAFLLVALAIAFFIVPKLNELDRNQRAREQATEVRRQHECIDAGGVVLPQRDGSWTCAPAPSATCPAERP
jgi:hypothetical protein